MKKLSVVLFIMILVISCQKPIEVDLLVINANVYTVEDTNAKAEAFAVKNGRFVAVGNTDEVLGRYAALDTLDAEGKTVVPGLIDAHCHFYGLGLQQQKVNLMGTKSYDEVLERIVAFQKEKNVSFITGRGWDQNDWEIKEYPTKEKLDSLFPDTPVAVTRVDGHAMIVNQKTLDMANITIDTKVTGGEILQENGRLTGVLIDNPMKLIGAVVPEPTVERTDTSPKRCREDQF